MKLSQLLSAIGAHCPQDAEITAITCDSRTVTPGALFVALEGSNTDGRSYTGDALKRGAAAVVCRPPLPLPAPNAVAVDDPRAALALLAAEFYGHPANEMTLIAITGTKGKTTTAHMLRDIFTANGFKTGMIGTLGAFLGSECIAGPANTTPEPTALHHLLRQMADGGCSHVVMEISSQAMKLRRTAGIVFDAALFLNLTPDHIGGAEHADFAEYRACKAALFRQCRLAVGNLDDPNWPVMAEQVPNGVPIVTFGFQSGADVQGTDLTPAGGLSTRLTAGETTYTLSMPGAFNAANALAAISLCRTLGVEENTIQAGLAGVHVPGRSQLWPNHRGVSVLIDYAHNGDSFRALLSELASYEHRRLIVVFGAGGDRPRLRRRDMAHAAAQWADFAVITADNPRTEPLETICADIASALEDKIPHKIIPDRREAIFYALDLAQPGDIVALLGKGHEEYIEVNGVKHPFSERAVLEEYFQK